MITIAFLLKKKSVILSILCFCYLVCVFKAGKCIVDVKYTALNFKFCRKFLF